MQSIEGRKIDMLRTDPAVCMEVDEYEPGSWCSVILWGRYEELTGEDALLARTLLRERFGSRSRPQQSSADAPGPVAFRIRCDHATGRRVSHVVD